MSLTNLELTFTEENLKRIAGPAVFKKGQDLVDEEKVIKFAFDRQLSLIKAQVLVSQKTRHSVQIQFNSPEKFKHQCTCIMKTASVCTHVAAVLIYFFNEQKKHKNESLPNTTQELSAYYTSVTPNRWFTQQEKIEKVKNQIDRYLYSPFFSVVPGINKHPIYSLQLIAKLLSNNKLMIAFKLKDSKGTRFLSNIEFFFKSLAQESVLVINRVEYQMRFEYFSNESIEMFNFFQEIILNKEPSLNYNKRDITLPSYLTGSLIEKMYGWEEVYNYTNDKLLIHNHEFEKVLNISLEFQQLVLNKYIYSNKTGQNIPNPHLLYTDHSIFYYDENHFYKLFSATPKILSILRNLKNPAVIPEEIMPNFLKIVVPELNQYLKIEQSQRIENLNLVEYPLKPKLYLEYDQVKHRILTKLTFLYGEYELEDILNLFSDRRIYINHTPPAWIVRDYPSERKYISKLHQWHFEKIDIDVYQLQGDDRIFHFLYSILPSIQSQWEISFHKNFNQLKIISESQISANISLSSDLNFFEITFSVPELGNNINIEEIVNQKHLQNFIKLDENEYLPIAKDDIKLIKNIASEFERMNGEQGEVAVSKGIYIYNRLKQLKELQLNQDQRIESFFSRISSPPQIDYSVFPESFNELLRDYQKIGLNWIIHMMSCNLGAILADDMGLGKTIQALGAIYFDFLQQSDLPNLVICPTSLLYNWLNEIHKFFPDLKCQIIEGKLSNREERIALAQEFTINITSYALLRNDAILYQKIHFNYIILDEAQLIKNPSTRNARAAKSLISDKRLILTGTPIENNISELWSMFDFLMPGFLFSHKRFKKLFEKPIILQKDQKAKEILISRVSPFILRRLKKDVLKELPSKLEESIYCEFSEDEKELYLQYLKQAKNKIDHVIQEKGIQQSQIEILAALTRLRQICCHPRLILDESDHKITSSKFELLKELVLEAIDSGHKILIFSQFVTLLNIIEEEFKQLDIQYEILTGQTKNRMEVVDRFNSNEETSVFLLSLKAGGTGLNLTSADIVIHYDPWWNPAIENQASDRIHRIGQTRETLIYKLIVSGTIEDKILQLQNKKRELIDSILDHSNSLPKLINAEDIENLFNIDF